MKIAASNAGRIWLDAYICIHCMYNHIQCNSWKAESVLHKNKQLLHFSSVQPLWLNQKDECSERQTYATWQACKPRTELRVNKAYQRGAWRQWIFRHTSHFDNNLDKDGNNPKASFFELSIYRRQTTNEDLSGNHSRRLIKPPFATFT